MNCIFLVDPRIVKQGVLEGDSKAASLQVKKKRGHASLLEKWRPVCQHSPASY